MKWGQHCAQDRVQRAVRAFEAASASVKQRCAEDFVSLPDRSCDQAKHHTFGAFFELPRCKTPACGGFTWQQLPKDRDNEFTQCTRSLYRGCSAHQALMPAATAVAALCLGPTLRKETCANHSACRKTTRPLHKQRTRSSYAGGRVHVAGFRTCGELDG